MCSISGLASRRRTHTTRLACDTVTTERTLPMLARVDRSILQVGSDVLAWTPLERRCRALERHSVTGLK